MNMKCNQRYEETERKIREVLFRLLKKKKFGKITVSEICREAGIHRTTFYEHYEDIYDLMKKLAAKEYETFLTDFLEKMENGKQAGFLQLFEQIRNAKAFYKVYLEENSQFNRTYEIFLGPVMEKCEQIILKMRFENESELYYHQAFFCAGLSAIIKMWLERDCAESPEEMCRILEKEYTPDKSIFM